MQKRREKKRDGYRTPDYDHFEVTNLEENDRDRNSSEEEEYFDAVECLDKATNGIKSKEIQADIKNYKLWCFYTVFIYH